MKKILCLIAAAALLLGFAACSPAAGAKDTLTGTPAEVFTQLKDTAALELGMTMDNDVTAENSQYILGLTPEQFGQYVEAAYESTAAIATFAQSNAVIKCKDAAAAAEVKKLIAAGFDSAKWICVFPEQSLVVESGSYVLLAVGKAETGNALVEALGTLSGNNTGASEVFYTSISGGADTIGPGGMAGGIELSSESDDTLTEDGVTDPDSGATLIFD